jgi:polysaccharide export outer membrane protein
LKLTRRLEWGRIPLANATDDQTAQFSVAEVRLKSILEAKNPAENIVVRPFDVISVPRADTIYVIGQVQKSGGFVLNDLAEVTVLQALSMAGGLDHSAKPQDAKILRRVASASSRTEIGVDLKKILGGKTSDVQMQPEDILFVPSSASKKAGVRALEALLQAGTGVAMWRIP